MVLIKMFLAAAGSMDFGTQVALNRAEHLAFQPRAARCNSEQKALAMQTDPRDRELERRVISFLAGRHLPGLRQIEVEARGGVVTLRGRVRTFYEKQVCHQCCRRVAGVLKLIDAIEVDWLPADEQLVGV